jgi:Na+/H+ antiporter NhaD/arsenite permease-like protein
VASLAVFAAVLACIITERIHLTIAAMLGAMVLLFLNVLTLAEAVDYIAQSSWHPSPFLWCHGDGACL